MATQTDLTQRLRRAVDHALTFSDDVADDRAVPFDDLVMRDRALAAFDAELRLAAATPPKTREASRFNTPEEFIDAYNQAAGGEADKPKVVRSKDVLDAIDRTFNELGRLKMLASQAGLAVYQGLARVPEFYAEGLTEVNAVAQEKDRDRQL